VRDGDVVTPETVPPRSDSVVGPGWSRRRPWPPWWADPARRASSAAAIACHPGGCSSGCRRPRRRASA